MKRKSLLKLLIIGGLGAGIFAFSNLNIALANDSSPIVESSPITSSPIEISTGTSESSQITSSESTPVNSSSEAISSENSSSEEIIYPCNVKLGHHKYGDILYDIEGGEIGDVVTLYVKPYSFYKIKSVTANGIELTPNYDGNYQFALAEGDNIVEAFFEIDDEQFAIIAEILENAKDGNCLFDFLQ